MKDRTKVMDGKRSAHRRTKRGKRSAHRRTKRGLSLMDVMVAGTVLTIGMAGIFSMLNKVTGAQRSLDLSNSANDAFARLAAQVRDAQCEFDGTAQPPVAITVDPGFQSVLGAGWRQAPVANSLITHVGLTDGTGPLRVTAPALLIEYRVDNEDAPRQLGGGAFSPTDLPSFAIGIRIRMLTGNATIDPGVDQGWWIKNFRMTKVCSARYDPQGRG